MNPRLVILSLSVLLMVSCKTNTVDPVMPPAQVSTGVYVLNEGNFGDPAGARLSFFDLLKDSVYFDLFENANHGAHLGSTGDDLKIVNGQLYVLMSGSENLVVLDTSAHIMVQAATYAGSVPHSMLIDQVRGKIYLTQLFSGSVLVADLSTLVATGTIPTGANPRGMVMAGDFIFVCNSGYGSSKTVSVINAATGVVAATVTVGDGPTDAVVGADGRIWVLCTGNAFGSPPSMGAVYVLNPVSFAVEDSLLFTENLWDNIILGNDGNLYLLGVTSGSFYGGPVHRIVPLSRAIEMNHIPGTYYSLAYDAATNRLYAADARSFQSDGEVDIYETDGTMVKSFATQRGPGRMVFRN